MTDNASRLETIVINFLHQTTAISTGWDVKPLPAKWSAKEVLGHLVDSAQVNLQRFVRCTYEEGFKLIYNQNEWVTTAKYQDADTAELLELWRLLNRQIIRVWQNYPPGRWQANCDTGDSAPELHTVAFLADDYVDHLEHHLKQIRTLFPSHKHPWQGNKIWQVIQARLWQKNWASRPALM